MNLSKRLQKVLDFVESSDKVADIGADHGYLTLAMHNKGVKYLQVVENKIGPLNRAKLNLIDLDNVIFSLSDGISDIDTIKNDEIKELEQLVGMNIEDIRK